MAEERGGWADPPNGLLRAPQADRQMFQSRPDASKMPDSSRNALRNDSIDESSGTPLYQQIYDILRQKIISGDLPLNARLPAEQELTEMLGVSRITVKRALNELAVAGFVRRQRGIGTVVTYDAAAPTVKGSFENLIDGLKRMGIETEVQLLDCTIGKPARPYAKAWNSPRVPAFSGSSDCAALRASLSPTW